MYSHVANFAYFYTSKYGSKCYGEILTFSFTTFPILSRLLLSIVEEHGEQLP